MINAHDLSMDQKSENRVADFSFLITVDGESLDIAYCIYKEI